ncbi:MAG: hypothetical protein MUF30_09685, partial [Burkholderiales bacterium]|nr:hypothetical protein [Burkholderiales bacterium]
LLLHFNLGRSIERTEERGRTTTTFGAGFQWRAIGALHVVGEVYRGDPYDAAFDARAVQFGFRHIFSDTVQVDGTVGRSDASGASPWFTLGLRVVSGKLW